jgi:hypothetical protein
MEQLITITGLPKSHNTKCLNALKPQKKFFSIQIGNSIEQQKAKNFIIMLQQESHAGNCQIKSKNIASNYNKNVEEIKNRANYLKKNHCHKPKNLSVNLWHYSNKS